MKIVKEQWVFKKYIFISLRKFFLNLSLKLVANPVVISYQGLCEDFLRRASYKIQLKKRNNVMLSVNSVTKMLTKERRYNDRVILWIYHS